MFPPFLSYFCYLRGDEWVVKQSSAVSSCEDLRLYQSWLSPTQTAQICPPNLTVVPSLPWGPSSPPCRPQLEVWSGLQSTTSAGGGKTEDQSSHNNTVKVRGGEDSSLTTATTQQYYYMSVSCQCCQYSTLAVKYTGEGLLLWAASCYYLLTTHLCVPAMLTVCQPQWGPRTSC